MIRKVICLREIFMEKNEEAKIILGVALLYIMITSIFTLLDRINMKIVKQL